MPRLIATCYIDINESCADSFANLRSKAAGLNNRTSKPTKIAEGRQVAVVGMEGEKDRSTLVEPATATCLPDAISDRSSADCTQLMRIVRQSAHLTSDIRLDGH